MKKFMNPVPERIKRKTAYLQKTYNMSLYDAFDDAVRTMTSDELHEFPDLFCAWYNSNYRNYIPQAYIDIALNPEQLAFKCIYEYYNEKKGY